MKVQYCLDTKNILLCPTEKSKFTGLEPNKGEYTNYSFKVFHTIFSTHSYWI